MKLTEMLTMLFACVINLCLSNIHPKYISISSYENKYISLHGEINVHPEKKNNFICCCLLKISVIQLEK